jgi:Ala-tRNA(Pro) deacylase
MNKEKLVFEKIVSLLDSHNVSYKVIEHMATPTSLESAVARGESIKIGAKALLLKGKKGFCVAVIPANRRLDTKSFRKIIGSKSLRFASVEELFELTGLPKGALPPFGSVVGLPLFVDSLLFEEQWMAFNAGDLCKSIKMKTGDYRKVGGFEVGEFSL